MSLKVILLIAVPMFVICCAILLKYWDHHLKKPAKQQRSHHKIKKVPETVITIERVPETVITICHDEMPDNQNKIEKVPETVITICPDEMPSDNQNEAEEKMAKRIFISIHCWLCVFDLLMPRQLGLGISMISHRFAFYVDVHFKTRKWTLKSIQIFPKFQGTGTMGVELFNANWKSLEITQKAMPKKVVGFEAITIRIADNGITTVFRRLRHFVPSILNDCTSLRLINAYYDGFFTEFPADDSATASNGQALAKWLFTPLQNDVPKVFRCWMGNDEGTFPSMIEALKSAFANASSPVNYIAIIRFPPLFAASVLLFNLTNGFTHEQLTLRMNDIGRFILIRCPIERGARTWAKWEKEAIGWNFLDQWNRIDIHVS